MTNEIIYKHLIPFIEDFFSKKGVTNLRYDGGGTDHADFVAIGHGVVGEIKHSGEIGRLTDWKRFRKWWIDTLAYDPGLDTIDSTSDFLNGFYALVCGQLYSHVKHFGFDTGRLVLEYPSRWGDDIANACHLLRERVKISCECTQDDTSVKFAIYKCEFGTRNISNQHGNA